MHNLHRFRPIVALTGLGLVSACSGDDPLATSALSLSPTVAAASAEVVAEPSALEEVAASSDDDSGDLAPAEDGYTRVPVAPLAESITNDSCDAFVTNPASETGSQVYQEVKLQTQTNWPSIDNILVSGGRAISSRSPVSSSTVGPVNITGASYGFYTWSDSYIRDLAISNIKIAQSNREGIRLKGNIADVSIRNFFIKMRDEPQSGTNLPEGIKLNNGNNIVIEDGCANGFKMVEVDGQYTNGDGISSERPVNNLTIRRVTANDNSDAGFDLKSNNTFMYDTHAARNFRNYRFWTKATTGTIYSEDPGQAHVWIGANAVVYIDKLVAKSSTPIYVLWADYKAKSITIGSCDLDIPNAKKFFRGSNSTKLVLGPGCTLD